MFALADVEDGVRRLTMPMPVPPGHVHCYLLDGDCGATLVDTGLGLPGLHDGLKELDPPVTKIAITHFHPDHVGGAGPAAEVTGARVLEGELDYEQCESVWGSDDWPSRIAAWFRRNGVPAPVAEQLHEEGEAVKPFIRFAREPQRLREGDGLAGWEVVVLAGHADGHLCFLRDGVLLAGDHLLPDITPAIGLYPGGRPDPLGDYLASLERTIELAPRLALPGHGEPISDPARRARELLAHHELRLRETAAALGSEPRTGHQVSIALFGDDLPPSNRRFAVAECLSHLERLVFSGRARRTEVGGTISYTAARTVGRASSE